MNIRTRLALLFFALVAIVVTIFSVSIYFFFADYRHDDFYRRLKNRAMNTVMVLVEFEEIDAGLLKKMERDNPANLPMQFVSVYDNSFTELYTSDALMVVRPEKIFLQRVLEEGEARFQRSGYEVLAFRFEDGTNRLIIVAGAIDSYGKDAIEDLRAIILVTFFFSLGIASVFGWIYSARVMAPVSKIVREVDNITAANLNQRLDEGSRKDELGKLAQTFNRMLSRLEAAFLAQKNFIANASHELKTPFTVMAGEIEVTLLHPREKEYYVRILHSVLEGIRRFNKLSTQLLLLAQTSSDAPQKRFSVLRIDDILWDAKTELERLHPEYIIDIHFATEVHHDTLLINGDDQLLTVLAMNLMDNGCKYGDNNSVSVTLEITRKGSISIIFQNSGDGINEKDLQEIFTPFFRGNSNKKVKGFGIGLSLADKIVKLHNGGIHVTSVSGISTRFIVSLPAEEKGH